MYLISYVREFMKLENNLELTIPKIFWKYYDLYRRNLINLEDYAKETGLSQEIIRFYLHCV